MIVAEKSKIKEMFQKNLQFLTPWLRESVLQIDERELWEKVEVTYNEEGYPICRYHQEDKTFRITGERPVQEAAQWSRGILKQGTGSIFLYGSGFGYPLFEIFAQKKPHTLVILFEENIYLFAAMLYYFDLEAVIKTQKIIILIGDTEYFAKAFQQLLFSIVYVGCTFPAVAFTHAAQRNFKIQYIKIHKYVFSELVFFVFYMGNSHPDNLTGFCNLLANTKEIVREPYISCLRNKYEGIPAFIIANGPSLDKNILQLKRIQDKGLIICGESAIIPLMKNNIKPDILTIVERTKYTYTYHFKDIDYPEDISLLCLALVDKQVYPSFPGAKIPIFRKGEAINDWINKCIGDGSAIDAGANVSHLAFELAVFMGAYPIIFVGQDYAYGSEGATHSKDAVYYEEKGRRAREIFESKPVIYVEGNDGNMLPSNQLWTDFRYGLERKIAAYPDKIAINATEGGARINGLKCGKLAETIEKYCTRPIPRRVHEIIAESKSKISIPERKEGLREFIKSMDKYSHLFRSLGREAAAGKLICRKMIRLSQEKDSEKYRSILEETYQKNINTYQLFLADFLYGCFSQQAIFVYYYMMDQVGLIDTPEKITRIFQLQYGFFHYLDTVCQSVSVLMEDAVELLEDILNNV
ncbi:MAG: motility associated factor glycosyltransferase family protein [Ruminiclostridium sp.]|nr:motility associated factor glycosyltransferase family protein [Ruminiclostridium sp.]